MSLTAGTRLGAYEIAAQIGAGGMGEVYRATDTNLSRQVAIKILPESMAADADRLARFDREARTLAALNHPNIAAIYGVEKSGGQTALVMELVEGPTLADRIAQGPLPIDDALAIATQIVAALEAAHGQGIIHRDLKPANIKLRPDGAVKVLDFGLAKAQEPAPAGSLDATASPTIISPAMMTNAGIILGTAAYMAPEQARGRPVDKRADIWAFGVVLYEMLAGEPLFKADTVSDTIAGVLTKDPDWSRVPSEVRTLLGRCLERSPSKRLRDIGDALPLLDAPPPARVQRSWIPWAANLALLIALGGVCWALWRATRPAGLPATQFVVDLDSGLGLRLPPPDFSPSVVLSRDGRHMAFVAATADGPRRIHVRRLDQSAVMELTGTDGARAPVFSPAGDWIAFMVENKLRKVPTEGGSVVDLADIQNFAGAQWADDRSLIVGTAVIGGLFRVPESGRPQVLLPLGTGELVFRFPEPLPGGDAVLFVTPDPASTEAVRIEAYSIKERRRTIVTRGTRPRYLPSGHLVFAEQGTLFAAPFDPGRLEITGDAVPIVSGIAMLSPRGAAEFDVSHQGTLVFRAGSLTGTDGTRIELIESAVRREIELPSDVYQRPRFSPDGTKLAALKGSQFPAPVVYDLTRETPTVLAGSREPLSPPVWTADGRFLLAGTLGGRLLWMPSDGSAVPQTLLDAKAPVILGSVAGDTVAYWTNERTGPDVSPTQKLQIWTLTTKIENGRLTVARAPEPFLENVSASQPALHPSGKLMAYVVEQSQEVQVRPFPAPAPGQPGLWSISSGGGRGPVWVGSDLVYHVRPDRLMAVAYRFDGTVYAPDKPREWRPGLRVDGTWDVSPDGQRVAAVTTAIRSLPTAEERTRTVFLGFGDEVRRRLAASK